MPSIAVIDKSAIYPLCWGQRAVLILRVAHKNFAIASHNALASAIPAFAGGIVNLHDWNI